MVDDSNDIRRAVAVNLHIIDEPSTSAQRRAAIFACVALALAGVWLVRTSSRPLPQLPNVAGIYSASAAIAALLTYVLLRPRTRGAFPQQLLAYAYLYSGLMAVQHFLHFPGAVLPGATLVGNPDEVGWLFLAWRVGFPAMVLYAAIEQAYRPARPAPPREASVLVAVLAAVLGIWAIVHWLPLPAYFPNGGTLFTSLTTVLSYVAAVITTAAIVVIWRSGLAKRTLYNWLCVVLFADAVGLFASTYVGARYTSAWYGVRVEGLVTSLVVLTLLARHFLKMQRSLASSVEALQAQIQLREKAEMMLVQAQKLEAVGQLAAGLAHDFNNLMQVISTRVELIRRKAAAAGVEEDVGVVRRTLHRAEALTRQLLVFSGKRSLQPVTLELGRWLASAAEMFRSLLRSDVQLVLDVPADVGAIHVDQSELESAFVNLVSNARDAMPTGGVLTIRARNERVVGNHGGEFVAISLADTGRGIAPELLPRVFEPFFTTKASGKGSGLGLSQVHAFSTRSGGSASIESTPGVGTTITLRFPKASSLPAAEAAAAAAAESSSGATPLGRGGLILVVDDNDDVRSSTAGLLEQLGYVVQAVASGREACDRLTAGLLPYAIVSDIVMPGGVDGIQLARAARQIAPHVRVILSSGYSAAAEAATAEGHTVLQKPYTADSLERALAQNGKGSNVVALVSGVAS